MTDLNDTLRYAPRDSFGLYGRGVTRRKLGDREGAEADIAAAKSVQSDIVEQFTHFWLKDF